MDLRRKCELRYFWRDEAGEYRREAGVVCCREVPSLPPQFGGGSEATEEPYEFFDLRKNPPQGHLCRYKLNNTTDTSCSIVLTSHV